MPSTLDRKRKSETRNGKASRRGTAAKQDRPTPLIGLLCCERSGGQGASWCVLVASNHLTPRPPVGRRDRVRRQRTGRPYRSLDPKSLSPLPPSPSLPSIDRYAGPNQGPPGGSSYTSSMPRRLFPFPSRRLHIRSTFWVDGGQRPQVGRLSGTTGGASLLSRSGSSPAGGTT